MITRHRTIALTLGALFFIALSLQPASNFTPASFAQSRIPAPEDVLGFRPGDDRKLASWAKVIEYFQKLDAASDRGKFEQIGKTTKGAPFVYATISAPENLAQLETYKAIQAKLADPRQLGTGSVADRRAAALVKRGKTVVAITCGIHSTEVGSYLSSMLIAHRLASSNDPDILEILRHTIVLLVPSTNPDGVDIVNNWYQKTRGTPYEGTEPPELYHYYTGHDNNRDWYAFTQTETYLVVDRIMNVWHPQIVHDIHQQGANGSRLFLPPYRDPVEPNVPKKLIEGYTELGNYMAREMRAAGFKGITTNSTYDAWTPARAYSHYHAGVRILSETASARLATPITLKFEQLNSRDGYDPKKESVNFGPVWEGGEWRLRDITNYMTTGAFTLLKHAAQNREHWLQRFYEIGKDAVRPRRNGELQALVVVPSKAKQRYTSVLGTRASDELLDILHTAGVEYFEANRFKVGAKTYPKGTAVIPMNQPYSAFAEALLIPRRYPDLRDKAGRPVAPYDVTAHTLSLLMNVQVEPVTTRFRYTRMKPSMAGANGGCGDAATPPRAIYKSSVASMDEGWSRWVLDHQGCLNYRSIDDREIRAGNISHHLERILIPDQSRTAILNGYRSGAMPPEYTGGLGQEGVKALREFVERGGTLVFLNRASSFAIEQFKLPVRDVVEGLPRTDFYVPGSILRIELDTNSELAREMPKESIAWVENSPVFEVMKDINFTGGSNEERRFFPPHVRVIARYPSDRDPLLSGWLLGGDRIKGKAALVEVELGKGRIILFGFRPQYRGQSLATYPLFFHAFR
jgi:hypothetical protein